MTYVVSRSCVLVQVALVICICVSGPRYVVQIGDKVIDYNEDFRLFLATRNPSPFIPPDAASVITKVNFTTTRAGLRGQVKNHTWLFIGQYRYQKDEQFTYRYM